MDNRTIEDLINTLYDLVQEARSVPLSGNKCMVDREEIHSLLDEMSANLPSEIKQSRTILETRSEIIANARKEAENIHRTAEEHARKLVSRDEIVKQAEKQAADIIKNAETKVSELKQVTNSYVEESLRNAEETVTNTLAQIRETRSKFTALTNPRANKPSPIIEDI